MLERAFDKRDSFMQLSRYVAARLNIIYPIGYVFVFTARKPGVLNQCHALRAERVIQAGGSLGRRGGGGAVYLLKHLN